MWHSKVCIGESIILNQDVDLEKQTNKTMNRFGVREAPLQQAIVV